MILHDSIILHKENKNFEHGNSILMPSASQIWNQGQL